MLPPEQVQFTSEYLLLSRTLTMLLVLIKVCSLLGLLCVKLLFVGLQYLQHPHPSADIRWEGELGSLLICGLDRYLDGRLGCPPSEAQSFTFG